MFMLLDSRFKKNNDLLMCSSIKLSQVVLAVTCFEFLDFSIICFIWKKMGYLCTNSTVTGAYLGRFCSYTQLLEISTLPPENLFLLHRLRFILGPFSPERVKRKTEKKIHFLHVLTKNTSLRCNITRHIIL